MSVSTLLALFLQSGFVLTVSLFGCLVTKRMPATRLAICRATILVVLALLVWRPWLETRTHAAVPIPVSIVRLRSEPGIRKQSVLFRPGQTSVRSQPAAVPVEGQHPFSMDRILLLGWLAGSIVLLANLVVGGILLRGLARRGHPQLPESLQGMLRGIAARADIQVPNAVVTGRDSGLCVAGVLRPTVFIPSDLVHDLAKDDLAALLSHEIAHIANLDLIWGFISRIATALLWWQPLVWAIRLPMENASEQLCDGYVVASGASGIRYADCLVTIREQKGKRRCPGLSIGAVSRRSGFGARIESILDPNTAYRRRLPRLAASGILLGAVVMVLAAPAIFSKQIPYSRSAGGSSQSTSPGRSVADLPGDGRLRVSDPILSFGPGKPFYGPAKLANGVIATLAFIQAGDLGGPHSLWSPDGSPAPKRDVARSLDMSEPGHKRKPIRTVLVRVEITGAVQGAYDCVVQVPQKSDWNVWQSYGDRQGRTMDLAGFQAPAGLQQTDMKFGIGAGPYRLVAGSKVGDGSLFPQVRAADRLSLLEDQKSGVSIKIRFPKNCEGKDATLIATRKDGQQMLLLSWEPETTIDPKTGEAIRTYTFTHCSPNDIDKVQLMVRDYQWVTFKGIHLYPNHTTIQP